jgi:hypothetical protein
MDILDSLRQAPSAELYRLYLAIGRMLDDPRRIFEIRQRLHLGMAVNYIGENPLGPPAQGAIVELRQTQAVVQDSATLRRWGVLDPAIIPETSSAQPQVEPTPPREEFFIGDTVGFTDKRLSERVGIIVRLKAKTASIAVNDTDGQWRVSYALLRKSSTSSLRETHLRVPLTDTLETSIHRSLRCAAEQAQDRGI